MEPAAVADEAGELDFSDLEEIIAGDDTPADEQPAADGDEVQELELDLDFDADGEAPPPAADEVTDSADELDLSDLGEKPEDDQEPAVESATVDSVQELDLDLDLEADTATEDQSGRDTLQVGDDDEFLDIEKMLEETEEAAVETESAGDADDLDFDSDIVEQDAIDVSAPVEDDLDLNLLESDEAALQEEVLELGPSDLQEVSAVTDGLSDTTDDFDTDGFTDTRDLNGETEIVDGLPAPPAMPKPKRGVRKPLTVFAVLLILLAGVLILPQNFGLKIPVLSDIEIPYITDIKIPYISDKFNPDAEDTVGNLRIIPLERTINYQFVENDNTGTLFVIKGRLKNDYNHPRKHIRITGKLFLKGNKLVKKATVFGGNLLTDKELASMNIMEIKKKLQNKAGNRKSNMNVRAGSVLPFMVVFDKLPQNLEEYTIEVAGSSS